MRAQEVDCLIVGGGVAGGCLALFLARRGLRVALADDGRGQLSGPYETVLGGTRAVWERMQLLDGVADGVAEDPLRHGAIWGAPELVWREQEEPGLLLARGTFDRALRAAAAAAGADVHAGTRVSRGADATWTVGARAMRPRVVAFATGRRSQVPLLPPYREARARTVAVTVLGEPCSADRGTAVVEAQASGWSWSHAPQQGPASAAVLMDLEGGATKERLAALLGAATGPAGRLKDVAVVRANEATAKLRPAVDDAFVVGDAAGTIDPLASQGAEKAVAAAEHAAAAIATAVEQPAWRARLCRAHARWEHELCDLHSVTSAAYYEEEARFASEPFWRARRSSAAQLELPLATPLRWREGVEQAPALVRHGDRFVELAGIRDPGRGVELARAGRVPTAPLLDLLAGGATAQEATGRAAGDPRLLTCSPRDVHDALSVLHRTGWLVT